MKLKKKKILRIILITIGVILVLGVTLPLLIPVRGETGLSEPEDYLASGNNIITIPFDGTDGIDIFYEYEENLSSERNFILLHGSLYNSKSWSEVMDYFSEQGNVYAYDQIPYGLSEKVLEGEWSGDNPYTTQAAIVRLKVFMDGLGIEKVTLVGSSFGAVLAAELALQYENRVESLILVDPAILVNESMPQWLVELPQVEKLGPMLASGLSKGDGFYESTFYNQDLLTDKRMELSKRETLINNWNLAMWEYLQAWSIFPSDVGTKLNEIVQPVLVISGAEDKIVPLQDSETIASAIPGAELVVIEECGHMPHEEKPDEFIEIVNNWLSE